MEQRNSQRSPVSLDVILNYGSLGLVHGRALDIGMGGMFVETGRIQLPVFATVEASLVLESTGLLAPMKIDTIVVRSVEKGVGLMFGELLPDTLETLRHLVRQSRSSTQPVTEQKSVRDLLH
jgi:hypothetical protein